MHTPRRCALAALGEGARVVACACGHAMWHVMWTCGEVLTSCAAWRESDSARGCLVSDEATVERRCVLCCAPAALCVPWSETSRCEPCACVPIRVRWETAAPAGRVSGSRDSRQRAVTLIFNMESGEA